MVDSQEEWKFYQWEGKQFTFSIPYKIINGTVENISMLNNDELIFKIKTNQNSSIIFETPYFLKSNGSLNGLEFLIIFDGDEKLTKISEDRNSNLFSEKPVSGNHELTLIPTGARNNMPGVYGFNELLNYPSKFSIPLSPKTQQNNGVLSMEVVCKENLQLIFKYDNSPACVKLDSIPKLIERGWAKSE